ncbi:MAG: prepilin-type N-terminal cleavage/methylation domain-containing protein [Candidatus Methylacidiphilales bacterium]|nr:prepilin-type N-terminal cleavage/methylation domain-containing protein [Candidatus Methylacidiphilales bacterium]
MKHRGPSKIPRTLERAFTMIELMAAMAVFAILGVIIAQALQATSSALAQSNKDLDAHAEMRQALDRIGMDLSARLRREDVSLYFQKVSGKQNDSFSFYSSVPSTLAVSSGPRGISQLFYRVGDPTSSNPYRLLRCSQGTTWSSAGGTGLVFIEPTALLAAPVQPMDASFDLLSAAIFRMEISYLSAKDTTPGTILTSFPATGRDWKEKVGTLCITMAALDGESRKLLNNPSVQLADLEKQFPDAADNTSTLSVWAAKINDVAALNSATSIPIKAVGRIRVMERRFSLY